MITFKSLDDLSKLSPDHPAYPVIKDLAQRLLVTTESMPRPYDPEADGNYSLRLTAQSRHSGLSPQPLFQATA